jgi:hypothetical protein
MIDNFVPSMQPVALKITVLICAALAASWLFRRSSAGWRAAIWRVAIVGVLLLPALSLILPGLPVEAAKTEFLFPAAGGTGPGSAPAMSQFLFVIWMTGFVAMASRLLFGNLTMLRVVRSGALRELDMPDQAA